VFTNEKIGLKSIERIISFVIGFEICNVQLKKLNEEKNCTSLERVSLIMTDLRFTVFIVSGFFVLYQIFRTD